MTHETTHGVMFHHFHGGGHPKVQGSISAGEFEQMLDWLNERYEILPAEAYFEKAVNGVLKNRQICISFDDSLLCQHDIAAPVLDARGVTAFFFVYSSPLRGQPDYLEIFRYFRTVEFDSVDDFYGEFFTAARNRLSARERERDYENLHSHFLTLNYLGEYPFYTDNDKWFRYLRDHALGKQAYEAVMLAMMADKGFDAATVMNKLWMSGGNIESLHKRGHIIGLHSDTHPILMDSLSRMEQKAEYEINLRCLEKFVGVGAVKTMSHPCGRYNNDTLKILKNLGIRLGFRADMTVPHVKSLLEIPREDCANAMRKMNT